MKFQDSSFNGLKVTVGTESVTHAPTHTPTDAPKAICPINFFKVGGIKRQFRHKCHTDGTNYILLHFKPTHSPPSQKAHSHYANMPMQYAAIFKGCKNDEF